MIFMELKDLLADEQFISEIIPLDSIEEVQKAFEEKGVKISIEECQEIGKAIRRIIAVTDDETENISGGGDDDIGAVSDYLYKLKGMPTRQELLDEARRISDKLEYEQTLEKAYKIGLGLGVALLPLGIYSSYKIGMYVRKKIGNWLKNAKAKGEK